jgi:calcineurin-like phosphoesterase family protein
MPDVFFISDTHFGHKNILTFEPVARPFVNLEEMHDVLVTQWNSVVKPTDKVYHLGDFAFGRSYIGVAALLNGKKRLILGNHDKYPAADYLRYFENVYGMIYYDQCLLSHMPAHTHGLGQRHMLNIHGHLHSNAVMQDKLYHIEDRNYFNVSCERIHLTPISYDAIRAQRKDIFG